MFADAGSGVPIPGQSNDNGLNLILSKDTTGPLLEHFEQKWARLSNTAERQPFQRHLHGSKRGAINLLYVDGHGGFARRFDQQPTDPMAPRFAYKPKIRVSPYNPGEYKK
jgi:prepilin-type processing-associated H-X9-DG protein